MNERISLLLTQIKHVNFEDVSTLPPAKQHEFIELIEELEELLATGVFVEDSKSSE